MAKKKKVTLQPNNPAGKQEKKAAAEVREEKQLQEEECSSEFTSSDYTTSENSESDYEDGEEEEDNTSDSDPSDVESDPGPRGWGQFGGEPGGGAEVKTTEQRPKLKHKRSSSDPDLFRLSTVSTARAQQATPATEKQKAPVAAPPPAPAQHRSLKHQHSTARYQYPVAAEAYSAAGTYGPNHTSMQELNKLFWKAKAKEETKQRRRERRKVTTRCQRWMDERYIETADLVYVVLLILIFLALVYDFFTAYRVVIKPGVTEMRKWHAEL